MKASADSGDNSKKPSNRQRSSVVFWVPLLALLIGVIIGSISTRGLDVFIGSFGNQPVSSNQGLPEDFDYSGVEEVYDALRKNFDGELNIDELETGMKRGLVDAAGDIYTTFLTADETVEFNGEVNGSFVGIGAELARENGVIIVVTPLRGLPAERAGLQARDIILKVDDTDATGISVNEAVQKIRGEEGTSVKLTVLRGEQQLEFVIVREKITIPSVTSEVRDGIGIMTISRFGEDTTALAREAADSFVGQNVKGIIVDVRNNPGGFLNEAVGVASLWAPAESAVVEERRDGQTVRVDRATGNPVLESIPTRVIINGGSASASEILAGALQDLGFAKLVGEQSFGKGSVQQLVGLSPGSSLKVTVARWFTPAGINLSDGGIKPDTEVKLSEEDIANKVDSQLNTAIAELQATPR